MPPKFDALGIVCHDIKKSLEFYKLLGIEPEEAEGDHIEATLPNGLRLMWDDIDLVKQINPNWVEPQGTRMGMAFLCESAAEVDQIYQAILEAGYHGAKEPWDAFWGQRYAQVVDPDGNTVDLFAWLS